MAYGHAERNLALIRQLEAETRQLLGSLDQLDQEQSAWLREVAAREDDRDEAQLCHRLGAGGIGQRSLELAGANFAGNTACGGPGRRVRATAWMEASAVATSRG